jgi:hypothetical protein
VVIPAPMALCGFRGAVQILSIAPRAAPNPTQRQGKQMRRVEQPLTRYRMKAIKAMGRQGAVHHFVREDTWRYIG